MKKLYIDEKGIARCNCCDNIILCGDCQDCNWDIEK